MSTVSVTEQYSLILIRMGVFLFLLGLFTGLLVPSLANPRMGLSSHVEGVMNGMLLIIMGLIWSRLRLPDRAIKTAGWLLVFGAYANWVMTLIAAVWAAGGSMMPIASMGQMGTRVQEMIIGILAVSLALALLSGIVLVLIGLRGGNHPVIRSRH
ncbi:MAG TPA: hydrogenase [Deltaproteobacteria bacterium]|nr:hydrogenase [Deltaproteobacteria bacterium]